MGKGKGNYSSLVAHSEYLISLSNGVVVAERQSADSMNDSPHHHHVIGRIGRDERDALNQKAKALKWWRVRSDSNGRAFD